MAGMLDKIAARRAELDALAEQLARQLEEVRAEAEELAVAEKVLRRLEEQVAAEPVVAAPGHVAGRTVLLVPHRERGLDESALPVEYRRVWQVVWQADGAVMAKQVCTALGQDIQPRQVEPMRGKLSRLAQRGWLRKTADGRFTATP